MWSISMPAARFMKTPSGCMSRTRDDKAVYLRGSEEHQHHSLVLRKAATRGLQPARLQGRQRRRSRQGRGVLCRERHRARLRRAAVPGPHAAVHRSLRLSDRTLRHDGEASASAAPLRSLQGLPSAAARPFQRVRRRGAGHRRLLRAAGLPPHRIWRGGRAERPHRRGMDASQGQRARFRHHQRPGPSPAPFRLLGADGDEHPASVRRDGLQRLSRRTSSAAPAATAFPTRFFSMSAIPTATGWSSTPATTSPWTTITSRCAGR